MTGRWFIIMVDVPAGTGSTANRVMIAMSSTSTITPSTVWTFFYFKQDIVSPAGDTGDLADYPTLGIDVNALYIGTNLFNSSGYFQGTTAFVVWKSSLINGNSLIVSAFRDLVTFSDPPVDTILTEGPYTPQGVDNFDTTATVGYFIGVSAIYYGQLDLRRVTNPGGTPSMSGNILINVANTLVPAPVNHLGNTGRTNGDLDAIDDRLMGAVIRNGNLWTSHSIEVTSSGTVDYNNLNNDTRDAACWYEINNLNGTPAIVQFGTVYDPTSPNDVNERNYWIPSIMVSGQGHAAMGFAVAGTNAYVNGATLGRLVSDPLGTMEGSPVFVTNSSSSYNPPGDPGTSGVRRWGDYSYTSVDPNDDMTMWTIQQFCNTTNSYGVQATKLLAPLPATPSSASPPSVNTGVTNTNVIITGTSSGGSGFFDPGKSFPNHISASVNGGGVTVDTITYTDPTHITLNLSVANSAAGGARTITVTNPDGQSSTSSSGIFTINASPTNPTALGNALPDTVFSGDSLLFSVTVRPGLNPTSSGITVNGNLSSIGGASTQVFFNDGTHGDVVAGDSIFSFRTIVDAGTIASWKSIPIVIADTQSRSDSITIRLKVRPPCSAITIFPIR